MSTEREILFAVIGGILIGVGLGYITYVNDMKTYNLYRQAGCEQSAGRPIPQHFLDNGYYLKEGWICPK